MQRKRWATGRMGSGGGTRSHLLLWALVAAQLLLPASAAAQAGADPVRGRLVSVIEEMAGQAAEDEGVPAVGVAVMLGDDLLMAGGFGTVNVERGVPATAQTVFRVGSVTKQFTAAAILQLAEEGRLSLDDDVTEHLPDFPTGGRSVTLHDLLNHTSGVRSYTALEEFGRWSRLPATDEEMVALFADEPFDFEPGTSWSYSNSGYYLLGLVVEAVSGLEYDAYLRQRILEPLGLAQTHYCHDGAIIPHRAAGYAWREGRLENASFVHMNTPGAAGALCATPLDLVQWTRALHDGRLLSAESLRLMTTPRGAALDDGDAQGEEAEDGPPSGWGYGLRVARLGEHLEIGHGGSINGFLASLVHYPGAGLTIAVLENSTAGNPGELARGIAARVLGVSEADLLP